MLYTLLSISIRLFLSKSEAETEGVIKAGICVNGESPVWQDESESKPHPQ
jgi:hypothetical protein